MNKLKSNKLEKSDILFLAWILFIVAGGILVSLLYLIDFTFLNFVEEKITSWMSLVIIIITGVCMIIIGLNIRLGVLFYSTGFVFSYMHFSFKD